MKSFTFPLKTLTLAGLLLGGFASMPLHAQSKVAPPLKPVLPQLKAAARVPVLLPRKMTLLDYREKPFRYFAEVEKADHNGYIIRVDDRPACAAMYCQAGYIEAKRKLTPVHGEQPVRLAHGITGYYTPMQLKVPAQLAFKRSGVEYRFTLGNSARQKQHLIQIANSALAAGPLRIQPATI